MRLQHEKPPRFAAVVNQFHGLGQSLHPHNGFCETFMKRFPVDIDRTQPEKRHVEGQNDPVGFEPLPAFEFMDDIRCHARTGEPLRDLLQVYGGALASTSANYSGQEPARNVEYALNSIDGEVDLTVDGGALPPDSPASTVIQIFADSTWKILRRGPVTETQIAETLR